MRCWGRGANPRYLVVIPYVLLTLQAYSRETEGAAELCVALDPQVAVTLVAPSLLVLGLLVV